MGRVYDIVDRIANANQKPVLKLDAEHEYKINNSFPASIAIKAYSEDKKLDDMERIEKVLGVALSKEANEYITSQEYPMPVYITIINTIMASIADMSLEDIEAKTNNTPSRE